MSIVVFAGPTLDAKSIRATLPEASVLGPAQCGDVYRAGRARPAAIALIDGYFDHRLSVWHKEILWVLAQGVRVYGAASMGALRAAELAAYGMVGVGTVYEAYRSGELEDDDEVAVAHEDASRGYAQHHDAMVNIRATLAAVVAEKVLTAQQSAAVVNAAKALFYAERSLRQAVRCCETLTPETVRKLDAWVASHGIVDVKRADAQSLLVRIRSDLATGAPVPPKPRVEYTHYLDALLGRLEAAPQRRSGTWPSSKLLAPPELHHSPEGLLELCGGDARLVARCWQVALERALALVLAQVQGSEVSAEDAQTEADHFRRQRGLLALDEMQRWMHEARLDTEGFSRLVHDRILIQRFAEVARREALAQLAAALDEVRAELQPD